MKWLIFVLSYALCLVAIVECAKIYNLKNGKNKTLICLKTKNYERMLTFATENEKSVFTRKCETKGISTCCKNDKEFRYAAKKFRTPNAKKRIRRQTAQSPAAAAVASLLPARKDCGRQIDNRIVGGSKTEIDEFPWLVLIEYVNKIIQGKGFACGGTIISSRYVLTAAHCVTGTGYRKLGGIESLWLGEHNTETEIDCIIEKGVVSSDCADPPVKALPEKIIPHEDYVPDSSSGYNDIALVRVQSPIVFTDFIKPICLPTAEFPEVAIAHGQRYTVAGWGKTEEGTNSPVKLKVSVPIVDGGICGPHYDGVLELTSSQICAGGEKRKDSCTGDSGGPLMGVSGVTFYTIAVVSIGPKPCGQENMPAIYTSVPAFMDWITNNVVA